MSPFLNPYQFIPVKPVRTVAKDDEIARGRHERIRHDCWQPHLKHGQVHVRLTTQTPTAVGAGYQRANPEAPARQQPYYRQHADRSKQLALPGNSLRGMIGQTIETISCSTMRVLQDQTMSVRKDVSEALPLIGWLQKTSDGWYVVPSCITLLKMRGRNIVRGELLKKIFIGQDNNQPMTLNEILPAYVKNSFIDDHECVSGCEVHAKLPDLDITLDELEDEQSPREIQGLKWAGSAIIAQQIIRNQGVQCIQREPGAPRYTRGNLRVFGITERRDDLPPTKRHEYFIPWTSQYPYALRIPDEVVKTFQAVAKARHQDDDRLPFQLKGIDQKTPWELEDEQYIYFDVDKIGEEVTVTEISISAIWRAAVVKTTHEFFAETGSTSQQDNRDLLPWSGNRQGLSVAEGLFGTVTSDQPVKNDTLPALASRLRFHDAIPKEEEVQLLDEARLQILSSPKPPSPNLYFQHPNQAQTAVKKSDLTQAGCKAKPRGRKVYLHHPREAHRDIPGVSTTSSHDTNNKQRIIVRAIPKGEVFNFTIDFENLNDKELSLLLTAIEPSAGFQHRLGLGKPLGLGSVKLEVQKVELHDRSTQRYSLSGLQQRLPVQTYYRCAGESAENADTQSATAADAEHVSAGDVETLRTADTQFIDQESLRLLITVGDPSFTQHHVCYPRTHNQFDQWQSRVENRGGHGHEDELFRWFNPRGGNTQAMATVEAEQVLKPLRTV
ncbi:MAG: TIGR03986 family CRISPR-associated RAMP protein [Wenzhouxiangellaceae bacterium]